MLEIFSFSIKMMFKNKVRSFLTMLGIIVGISSLIFIVVIGDAFTITYEQTMDELLDCNRLLVEIVPSDDNKNVMYDEYDYAIIPEDVKFDIRDVNNILYNQSNGKTHISTGSFIEQEGVITNKGKESHFQVVSSYPDEVKNNGLKIITGRDITAVDEKYYSSTAVISKNSANTLFEEENIIGKSVNLKIGNTVVPIVIVGIYENNDIAEVNDASNALLNMYINHSYIESHFTDLLSDSYWKKDYFFISLKDITNQDAFKADLQKELCKSLDPEKWTVNINSVGEMLDSITSILNIVIKIVFVIACISLLIGGIGVMNVMLITVTERTNEIGVRKALGASDFCIIYQFLCESFVISLTGTILGTTFGMLLSNIAAPFISILLESMISTPVNIEVSLPIKMLLFSAISSLAIGVIFGVYPAQRAVKMQVVEALRYE